MTVTYSTAIASNPALFGGFGAAIVTTATGIESFGTAVTKQAEGLGSVWNGDAFDAQKAKAGVNGAEFTDISGRVEKAGTSLLAESAFMVTSVQGLRTFSQSILDAGYLILPPMGTVIPGPKHYLEAAKPGGQAVLAVYIAIARTLTVAISQVVTGIRTLDQRAAKVLEETMTLISRNPGARSLPTGQDWVARLSDEDRASYHRVQGAVGRARARSAEEIREGLGDGRYEKGKYVPELRSRFVGSEFEKAVANDPSVAGDPNITHTGPGRKGTDHPDFTLGSGKYLDVTGGARSTVQDHYKRPYYDSYGQLVTYPSYNQRKLDEIFS